MSSGQKAPAPRGFIALFASHRVASNLLMGLMILAGLWALDRLNTQFFPEFEVDLITVNVVWSGASAEDVERAITVPIERELKGINGIEKNFATSSSGMSSFRLEVDPDTEIGLVLDDVKQAIDSVTNLPEDAEEPVVQKLARYESVAKVLVTGTDTLAELVPLVYRMERELLSLGIRKVNFTGMPDEEIAIQIAPEQLHDLGLTLEEVAALVRQRSRDLPAGTAGRKEGSRMVRSLGQERSVGGFESLPLLAQENGVLLRLGDVARIERRPQDGESYITYKGKPAIQMSLMRAKKDDTLNSARLMNQWLEQKRAELPSSISLIVYDESWTYLRDRINLLLKNGLGGLVLVIAILFLFLNVRVAWWVTVGIPVSFLAALAVLYLTGGSINLISLFGMIMTLGIIVDDAIVVGENTLARLQSGDNPLHASVSGARRMLAPVVASSMTTIAAFLPLLMIGGNIGNVLIDIPTVVICVIIASLVECLLILPGHLRHSLKHQGEPGPWRQGFDAAFDRFREQRFRRWVRLFIAYRTTTITAALALFVVSLSLVATGWIKFTFFPTIDSTVVNASVQFSVGTSDTEVNRFLSYLEETLFETDAELGGGLVVHAISLHKQGLINDFSGLFDSGDEYGALKVEIVSADQRTLTNQQIIDAWRSRIQLPPGIEKFSIAQQQAGPPGKPVEIKLVGGHVDTLKEASLILQRALLEYRGVSNVDDDLPYGREQIIYRLKPAAQALGLTLQGVGRQLRSALDGQLVQVFHDANAEVEVRVVLPDVDRDYLNRLRQMPFIMPNGQTELLDNVVEFVSRQGIDSLNRVDGELAVLVTADVDETSGNADEIISQLQETTFVELQDHFGVRIEFEGRSAEQRETIADMLRGLVLALLLIYIILAWVFSSYSWPFAVMLAIPFGVTGAILGHLVMGLDMTILSLFGVFGLTGIVINDSIVLISFYHELREQGWTISEAIVEAACKRLRAVLLTSLTTIAGLTPILFETSLQAQFLIPMATSIVFGLAFGTLLVLLVIPAQLIVIESLTAKLRTHRHLRHSPMLAQEGSHETL
ncbi:efflux RND transporter permease subunit [Aestuariirhabdus litorea]|uniref:Efflux RND transporter permease subunit n=1 Tax=Aestuariirhabdus litorea TaxID=2528527 RepID=A0A3P3VPA6_9GAMM|nr:efflux RND transporter permease subunit [Aestuariirhabdus litorea]RRJ84535.1 efflux RND transporter permease subunit [Aestuariirhabdus litorea]RWW97760.1 efflux RND transporter permease subunit [Endozoicomonadaceae bacterium GTF-13]